MKCPKCFEKMVYDDFNFTYKCSCGFYINSDNLVTYHWDKVIEPETFEDALNIILKEQKELTISKDKDYGPNNIKMGGLIGNLIRINDKWERIKTLTGLGRFIEMDCNLCKFAEAVKNGEIEILKPNNESLEDTFKDMANYFMYMRMLLRGWWTLPREQ